MEDRNKYHLEDIIQLPKKNNPNNIYKKLDEDKNIYSEKYKNICRVNYVGDLYAIEKTEKFIKSKKFRKNKVQKI